MRFYLKKIWFARRGEEKSVESFDTWRGLIACSGKYFALNRWPGTTRHAPFQRFLPASPRYLARGNDESADFSASGIFLPRDTLGARVIVRGRNASITGARESRKYAPRKKEDTRFQFPPVFFRMINGVRFLLVVNEMDAKSKEWSLIENRGEIILMNNSMKSTRIRDRNQVRIRQSERKRTLRN